MPISNISRRSLITGLISFVASPAIVRASSLMRLSGDIYELWDYRLPLFPPIPHGDDEQISWDGYRSPRGNFYEGIWTFLGKKGQHNMWTDERVSFERVEMFPNGQ